MVARARRFEIRGPMWHKFLAPFMEGRFQDIPREQCWWGPAGTAKTMSTMIALDAILRDPRFEGVRALWIRKTRQSVVQSSLVTFETKVLHPEDPMIGKITRQGRESYLYKRPGRRDNELVIGGMNLATRLFGQEYDIVIVEEAIEFEEAELETIWRAMRNYAIAPGFAAMILLTNPDSEFHWLYQRMKAGVTSSYFVGIECNPRYFDLREGRLTPEGHTYRADLASQMHDERYMRLSEGRWCNAEGQILKSFCRRHVIRGQLFREPYKWAQFAPTAPHPTFKVPLELRWFFASMDFGDRNPGCIEVWGVTKEGTLVRVAEVYHADRDIKWWAEWCAELYGEFGLKAIVCDSSRPKEIDYINDLIAETYRLDYIEETNQHGEKVRVAPRIAIPCEKNTRSITDLTNVALLRYAFGLDDGIPRIYLAEGDERVFDKECKRNRKPTGLIEEIPGWTWAKHVAGKHTGQPKELPDEARPNHGIDATAYAIAYAWGRDLGRDPSKMAPKHPPGTYGHARKFIPWLDPRVAARIKKGR